MSIECYDDTCPNHPGDEPFCEMRECDQRFCGYCGKRIVRHTGESNYRFDKRMSCDKVCGALNGKQKMRVKQRRTKSCDYQFLQQ
jgi:hypothetical protein